MGFIEILQMASNPSLFAGSQAAALQRQDLDDNRTGVVRHFKQPNLYKQADIDNAVAEAHESNSLNLEDHRLPELSDSVFEVPGLLLLHVGWTLLTNIDPRVEQLRDLKVLEMTHNYITELPEAICLLPTLKVLNA